MKKQNKTVFAELTLIFGEIYFSNYWYLPVNTFNNSDLGFTH